MKDKFARVLTRGRRARYLWSVVLVVLATAISALVDWEISPVNLVMLYLLAVVVAAVYLGRGPAVLASVLGVLLFDFFFVPPRMTFSVADTEYLISFAGLLGVGLVISYLTVRAREQAEAARQREADTAVLYALSRALAGAESIEDVLEDSLRHIKESFGKEVVILLAESETLRHNSLLAGSHPDATESAAALWAFQNGETAGRGTGRLADAHFCYLPLKTARRTVGVLGLDLAGFGGAAPRLPEDRYRLLQACASLAAQAVERVQLAGQTRQIELMKAAEKLQNALLSSISHDLRTPLVSITGALSTLEERDLPLNDADRRSLVETAREEAERLNRLVGNLLDMTRLESGALRIKREPCDVQEIIGTAIEQMAARLNGRSVGVDAAASLPLVPMDYVLIVHVLTNLLDNALKYSPAGSPVEVRAHAAGGYVEISVADRGVGIPPGELAHVFDKFYRVQRSPEAVSGRPDNVTGTGLGLSISKGIVEAHGGFMSAENRPEGGTMITLGLPVG